MIVRSRLAAVRDRVARAAERIHRDPSSIRIVAVSKTFSADRVRAAADAGQLDFGENKVQEALEKIAATGDLPLRWHLVGHLQSNKARKAAGSFDVIHSIDDEVLLRKVDEAAQAAGRHVDLLIQVDLAGEPTKHGARPDELPSLLSAERGRQSARVRGLMLLPPATIDPERGRAWFAALRTLRDRLLDGGVDSALLAELSMGMSHDFEVAVEEGATMVRIGTAIFGERP